MTYPTIRCGACHRKLAEGAYSYLAIKCPRCGVINQLKAVEPPTRTPRASTASDDHDTEPGHPSGQPPHRG
ncbi:Com family DNA-binding transcriptional regulator [Parachitinimonas caeni]|uniref:Com family DNA-binding transcriptional regulator n=1 Tax=Parachitinimonas caeni TaxID=3031301 RepID=A0ABT7DWQ9_9NEIS|nr:Com family DNA-binding transcriptional regulator [Parachitinimonas caeni]MDK2124503.1 Com family DNA-binding transcriptional regulator [Parachitinimonas caeni]